MHVRAKTHLEDGSTIQMKIERAAEGISHQFVIRLLNQPTENASDIANFLLAAKSESNISDSYRENLIFTLYAFQSDW